MITLPYGDMGQALQNNDIFHLGVKEATMSDEPSLSHYLRFPSAFLGGKSYGQAFAQEVLARGLIRNPTPSMLEIGGGTGDFVADSLPIYVREFPHLTYDMVDLSPKMLEAQKAATTQHHDRMSFEMRSAELLKGQYLGIDYLVSNEVLADLSAIVRIPNTKALLQRFAEPGSDDYWRGIAWDLIDKHQLEMPESEEWIINWGALKLLEDLPELLSESGSAVFIEHSSKFPIATPLRNHKEYSLSHSHFQKVAEDLGFSVQTGNMLEFLHIEGSQMQVEPFFMNLSWMAQEHYGVSYDELGRRGKRAERETLRKMLIANPEQYAKLDRALTPKEFLELAEEENWNTENTPLTEIGNDTAKFRYFILQKTQGE